MNLEGLFVIALFHAAQVLPIENGEYREASRYASLALFEQSGIKTVAEREKKGYSRLYKRNLSSEAQTTIAWTAIVAKAIEEKKIVISWSF